MDKIRITSRDNQRIINAIKIRDGRIRSAIFIEGRRLADDALRSDVAIQECLINEQFGDQALIDLLLRRGIPVVEIPAKLFRSIADTENPQGIILIGVRPKDRVLEDLGSSPANIRPTLLFLNAVNNPLNLGSILRTAEAAGMTGVVVSPRSADPFSPRALRASMGSAFRISIFENVGLIGMIEAAKRRGMAITAADINAEQSYTEIDWREPSVVVFGSEGHGLSSDELRQIEIPFRIPMASGVESLNLAAAAAVVMYEIRRQNERTPA